MSKTNTNIIESVVAAIKDCADGLEIEPNDVLWNDLQTYLATHSDFYNISWGDAFKHKLKMLGGFRNIRDANFTPNIPVENVQVMTQAKQNRADAKSQLTESIFNDKFFELMEKASHMKNLASLAKSSKVIKPNSPIERKRHIIISDTHFGADLNPAVGVRGYGKEEESRSLAQIVLQTIEFKQEYNEVTQLHVNINGDIIMGKLHDAQAAAKMAEQFARSVWLLQWALYRLSTEGNFSKIIVNCATGNHDRDTTRHHNRAVNDKWDSEATKIYFALKMACSSLSNVVINIPMTPYVTYDSFGDWYYGTHGDTHINPGNPGSNINVTSLENQINRLNASLSKERAYKVVFLGHVHTGLLLKLTNGVTLITNPPLIPSDEYAQSVGYWECQTGQWLWESIKGHAVGDSRFLKVDESTRKDSSLDKFIPPWQGF